MRCEDCRGSGLTRRHFAETGEKISLDHYRTCRGCGGTGIVSCCDRAVGRADDTTNQGGQDARPTNEQ